MWRRFAVRMVLIVSLGVLAMGASEGLAQDSMAEWANLGPSGALPIDEVAATRNWRDGGILLGLRGYGQYSSDLVRTFNAGQTWERLPGPGPYMGGLTAEATMSGMNIVFVTSAQTLYRSIDNATSWQAVLTADHPDLGLTSIGMGDYKPPLEIIVSPNFATDGTLMARSRDRLFRSRDWGSNWQEIVPILGQQVHQVIFSPDYEHDRTLFAAVITGDFPEARYDTWPREGPSSTDHEQSAGILISTDGGDNWAAASSGLEVGGVPYRHVQRVIASPTYSRDRTLFAIAWGPRGGANTTGLSASTVLFRSADGGGTWGIVDTGQKYSYSWPNIVLSSTFADDGIAIIAWASKGTTPASSSCPVARSEDRGVTWTTVLPARQYSGCGYNGSDPVTGARQLFISDQPSRQFYVNQDDWERSDDGKSWTSLSIDGHRIISPETVLQHPDPNGDQSIFVASLSGDLLIPGQSMGRGSGTYSCTIAAGDSFASLASDDAHFRSTIGCAVTPEADAAIIARADVAPADLTCSLTYWIDGGWPYWLALRPCRIPENGSHSLGVRSMIDTNTDSLRGKPADAPVRARVQRFEKVTLLSLSSSQNGNVVILLGVHSEADSTWEVIDRR